MELVSNFPCHDLWKNVSLSVSSGEKEEMVDNATVTEMR